MGRTTGSRGGFGRCASSISLGVVAVIGFATPAAAAPIAIHATGHIVFSGPEPIPPDAQLGTPISISIEYDTEAPAVQDVPGVQADYLGLQRVEVDIGDSSIEHSSTPGDGGGGFRVVNDGSRCGTYPICEGQAADETTPWLSEPSSPAGPVDEVSFDFSVPGDIDGEPGRIVGGLFGLRFFDPTGASLSDVTIPTAPSVLESFGIALLESNFVLPNNDEGSFIATIDEFTVVPEPSIAALQGLCLSVLARLRGGRWNRPAGPA